MNPQIHLLSQRDGCDQVLSDMEVEHLQRNFSQGSFSTHRVMTPNGTTPWVVFARMSNGQGYFRFAHRGETLQYIEKSRAMQVCGQLSAAAKSREQA